MAECLNLPIFASQLLESMKRTIIFSLFFAWLMALAAQPQMQFDKQVSSLGSVLWANPVSASFKVTNVGNEPLELREVKTSCACTVADWTKSPIQPGQSGVIMAVFDAKALGHFYKEVEIHSNATEGPVYLQMEGKVVASGDDVTNTDGFEIEMGDVKLDKDAVFFNGVKRGDEPVEELNVLNTSRAAFEPVLMHVPDYLEVTSIPKRIAPGRNGKIRIKLLSDKIHDSGLTQTTVYLSRFFGDKVSADNEMSVMVMLAPELKNLESGVATPVMELSSKEISLPLKNKPKGKTTVLIRNSGRGVLNIDRLQVFSSAVSVNIPKKQVRPGEIIKMKIAVDKTKLTGGRQPRVLIVSNDPDKPAEMVTIKLD